MNRRIESALGACAAVLGLFGVAAALFAPAVYMYPKGSKVSWSTSIWDQGLRTVTFLPNGGPATIYGPRAYAAFCAFRSALDASPTPE